MSDTRTPETVQSTAQQIVDEADSGARRLSGLPGTLLLVTALCWSLFQLWYASPLPFIFDFFILNDTEARAIHLAFAIFMAFLACPALKRSPRNKVPAQDWLLALAGAFSAAYIFLFYDSLAERAGAPITPDLIFAGIGILLLLEATRRALGPPLMCVAALFLVYVFAGQHMPEVIAHKGASLNKALSHFWLTTEGVFGVALGVSTNFVFLFVLFGALLDRAGAGQYFIRVAFSLLGHLKGGPAKAAVVSSGLSGIISGSSIANVVTTGTFTIPLMKRVGFPGSKAGAIEVAASTNGQLTPPIMGAAAFLMVEYVGISYLEVIKSAILPAAISYIALFYIVHLEAVKAGMEGLPRRNKPGLLRSLLSFSGTILGLCILSLAVYYGIGWTKTVFGDAATWIVASGVLLAYLGLTWLASRSPENHFEQNETEVLEMPPVGPTVLSGLHFLLPIVVLIWCIAVERFSPGLSAFWATVFLIGIVVTQRPLITFFQKTGSVSAALSDGITDLLQGLVSGARNMVGIGVATAAAGIVVGAVTLTGIGQVMTEFVEFIANGNILLMLIFTAVISLLLGMGLPTTANYIVVSTLMAPVIVTLGAQHGLIVPLIAVHLFVFYFGILADDTPPVGLAAFAAAAIAKSDPIRTGIQGFTYDIRTAILPFMFIFNTELLLIGITSIGHLVLVVTSALAAMLIFATATQGYWLTRTRWYETILLLVIAFVLFRPGFIWDRFWPERIDLPGTALYQQLETLPENTDIRLRVSGETLEGKTVEKTIFLPTGSGSVNERLATMGLELLEDGNSLLVDNIEFGSAAEKAGLDFDWKILNVETDNTERPAKQWLYLPTLLLLAVLYLGQRRRRDQNRTLDSTTDALPT
ncbi:TRAP transporter permease [Kistimonas asteriae]|uniref:TRAP transporter permease n=1 Tax=Kistimonas asteriae TaxID=517724 RepID=UPI001BA693B7